MTLDEYERFTERLYARLATDPRVLALVALGSTALAEQRDAFSDHDVWVVVRPGSKATLLADLSWLPDAGQIIATIRPWEHYGTVLYANGHIVEFGVFEPDQLRLGRLGKHRILFDHHGIAARLAEMAVNSCAPPSTTRERWDLELFLVMLLTGARRAARGERLSAHNYLADHAVDLLLGVLVRYARSSSAEESDPLDPWRRLERAHPELAEQLLAALYLPAAATAARLLDIADRALAKVVPHYPVGAAAVVRAELEALCITESAL